MEYVLAVSQDFIWTPPSSSVCHVLKLALSVSGMEIQLRLIAQLVGRCQLCRVDIVLTTTFTVHRLYLIFLFLAKKFNGVSILIFRTKAWTHAGPMRF